MPLTDAAIKRATPRETPYKLADGGGLYLYIAPGGGKLWRLKYRIEGREKTQSFGPYPVVTLARARELRAISKRIIAAGADPIEHEKVEQLRAREARNQTFEGIARAWCEHMYDGWKPGHSLTVISYFERDVFPAIGDRPISTIEAPELTCIVKAIEKRGALDIAKRIAFRIGAVYKFAKLHGYCQNNPAEGLSGLIKARKATHYAALEEADLPEFLKALSSFHGHKLTELAVRLQLLTVVRSGELRGARWDEFDLKEKLWRIPGERMKMKMPHLVPLSRQTLGVIKQIREITGDRPLLFPNRNRPDQPFSENTVNTAIADMGFKGRATGHGFRSTFSTLLNERNLNRDWIERQLAHAERSEVRAAYNAAEYLEQRTDMMQLWADLLDAKASGTISPKLRLAAG